MNIYSEPLDVENQREVTFAQANEIDVWKMLLGICADTTKTNSTSFDCGALKITKHLSYLFVTSF